MIFNINITTPVVHYDAYYERERGNEETSKRAAGTGGATPNGVPTRTKGGPAERSARASENGERVGLRGARARVDASVFLVANLLVWLDKNAPPLPSPTHLPEADPRVVRASYTHLRVTCT